MSPNGGGNTTGRGQPTEDLTRTLITSISASFAVQSLIAGLPDFDGRNLPLKDFIQDVKNGAEFLPQGQEANYVRLVIGKLRGPARDSTYGQTFANVTALCSHLKKRFAPGKDYSYYNAKIHSLRMKHEDSVGDFYDRLNILLSSAENALKEEQGNQFDALMMTPLKKSSMDIFIRGLPRYMRQLVGVTHPTSLQDAFKAAVEIENKEQIRMLPKSSEPLNSDGARLSIMTSQTSALSEMNGL